ncbi:hypothetical protein ACFQ15_03960 [Sphingomonas hankookensis]|uniref:hypothetical protein n=1 Tax=Sphingomonas hankookensis TaxID=563996 RepID=UPI001F58077F|nr:hypothetical protein [Sphingomonas hankookensis]
MQDEDPFYYLVAFILVTFAGLTGAAHGIAALQAGRPPNGAMTVLALLCLPTAVSLGLRAGPAVYRMCIDAAITERRIGIAFAVGMLCGMLGAFTLSFYSSDAATVLDDRNDWIAYVGFVLLGASLLLLMVGGFIRDFFGRRES